MTITRLPTWSFHAVFLLALSTLTAGLHAAPRVAPTAERHINSIGMRFARIESGTYRRGQIQTPLPFELLPVTGGKGDRMDSLEDGDFDEKPVHTVGLSQAFYMGTFEVSNEQFELFDPRHRERRGQAGLSHDDDEAVIFVNWYEANSFCQWLSDKEGLPYRLPTEAEWEYACRAGTTSHYSTGTTLPAELRKNQHETKVPEPPISLHVGRTTPNAWGLSDMHGNVAEWCHDWYGNYRAGRQIDPVGYARGEFRVTRGGSHSTTVYSLRSANRMAALPEDRHWMLGFRVVLGELPQTRRVDPPPPLHQQNVEQRRPENVRSGPSPETPYFSTPRKYVKIPTVANGPLFSSHNHDPAIVECPNGDLLAMWYTCDSERNRELGQAASRLRWGTDEWEPASPFFDVPDRNDHAPAMWNDGRGRLYHLTGMSFAGEHAHMALVQRTSPDSGATWSRARIIGPDYNWSHMPGEPVLRLQDGGILFGVDYQGGSQVWISRDEGLTWTNPGGVIRGIHAGIAQLRDGSLFAFGRGGEIDGRMPISISQDLGKTFTYRASEFPHVDGGQRLVLLRLREGPLLLASFADKGISIEDVSGTERSVRGLYAAVSHDDGKSWPHKRLVSHDGPPTAVETSGGGLFTLSATNGEPHGYMSVCQSTNGLIHLISSRQHYSFNFKWLLTPAPAVTTRPLSVLSVSDSFNGPGFDTPGWVDYKSYTGGWNGSGGYEVDSRGRSSGLNRILGAGSFDATVSVSGLTYRPRSGNTTPGPIVRLRDARARGFTLRFGPEKLHLSKKDEEPPAGHRGEGGTTVAYDAPPKSAKVRLVWNEGTRELRLFYGLDGAPPTTPATQKPFVYGKPFSESTAFYVIVEHGHMVIEDVKIRAR